MKISITNTSGVTDSDVYVYLTGTSFSGSGISEGKPVALSTLTNNSFDVTELIGGRMYVSFYKELPTNPVPNSNNYYGYIEFTLGTDNVLWADISSVDVFGVPLAFSVGTYNLGYSKSHNTILKQIKSAPGMNGEAIQKKNRKGNIKLVGANVAYNDQPSYDDYINELKGSSLHIKSLSDSPLTYDFSGTFNTDGSISLASNTNSDTFSIPAADLTSAAIYLCNGNCVFNGHARNAMTPNDTCAAVYRDVMIGYNEGYFTENGTNNSSDFPNMTPFASGFGNVYAKYIHEGSDAYGYPFADSNLKTLINLPVDDNTDFTLTILSDDTTS